VEYAAPVHNAPRRKTWTSFSLLCACACTTAAFTIGSSTAAADVTGPTGLPTAPTAAPSPSAKKSSKHGARKSALPAFTVAIAGAYKYHGHAYVLPRALVEIKGKVGADLDGQVVNVLIKKGNHLVKTDAVRLTARGGSSSFKANFRVGKKGKYVAEVQLTPAQLTLVQAGNAKSVTIVKTGIHRGSKGVAVKLFQSKLAALHYVVPRNGRFDEATGRAFIAFRKVNGMARVESGGYKVARKLAEGKGTFHLRYKGAGRHVEVSIKKQVMAFADHGKVQRIYHVSTGAGGTPTVRGTFHVYRKDPGTNAKGMVKSNYFIRGYAIHGYAQVPTYNASHGCVRTPIPNAVFIYNWIQLGESIYTYY
jgi:hypothetical protein